MLPGLSPGRLGVSYQPPAPTPEATLAPSDLLSTITALLRDRYAVAEELGRGGMATVFRATDVRHDRTVALKLLFPELAKAVGGERFLREISILARLSHPNILPLLDSGKVEVVPGLEVPYYVMPFVRDDTLRARLTREGPLPLPVALRYTREICSALAHAHQQGFIHRDIKPENILLQGDHAVVADFGIARAVTVAGGGTLSSSGLVVGTPIYMSPEQSVGSDKLDARSDLYSLGCVLFEMLAGQPPFTGATPQAISARHQFEPPPPIRVVRPGVPEKMEWLLSRALAKVPADRVSSAVEFEARLAEVPSAVELPTPEVAYLNGLKTGRWHARPKAVWSLGVAVVGAVLAAILLSGGTGVDPERVVVIPFKQDQAVVGPVSGLGFAALVYDAMSRWSDLRTVDPLRVQSAIEQAGMPRTLDEAEGLARRLGAGRLIWGQLLLIGDSVRGTAYLYRIGRFGSRTEARGSVEMPATNGGVDRAGAGTVLLMQQIAAMSRQLLVQGEGGRAIPEGAIQTTSLGALRAYLAADSAMAMWNLRLAKSKYLEALSLDGSFPKAALMLAQLAEWGQEDPATWRSWLTIALAAPGRLSSRERRLVKALAAMADRRHPDACQVFRQLVGRDSTDFVAWLGLGDCHALDPVVLPDSSSPSGLAFRGSYAEGLRAYAKAMQLVPLMHEAFAGVAISRLLDRYFVESNSLRGGQGMDDGSLRYAAYPVIDHDSLGFIPRPIEEVLQGRWPNEHDPSASALGRRLLRDQTLRWVQAFPASLAAWRAHAIALELTGALAGDDPGASALAAIRRGRNLPAGSHEAMELAVSQVRILVKLQRLSEARLLADSLLIRPAPADEEEGGWMAGLSALAGKVELAVALGIRNAGRQPFVTAGGAEVEPGLTVAEDVVRLTVYASFPFREESTLAVGHRLLRPAANARGCSPVPCMDLADQAVLLAFPLLGAPHGRGGLRDIEQALAAGDSGKARRLLGNRAEAVRQGRASNKTTDTIFLEARLWLLAGDSVEARREVARCISSLPVQGLDLVTEIPQAAAIGGCLDLASRLSVSEPDRRAFRERLEAVWSNRF